MLHVTFLYFVFLGLCNGNQDLPDVGLNIKEYLKNHEYPLESHNITTEDGYILQMHRITSKAGNFKQSNKPPVLLVHGLESSSMDYVNYGSKKSIGLMLADRGFDVWLGNCRGNTWSKNHVNLTTDQREFWNFSFHEIAKYDLPAKIDYILKYTNKTKLSYIGHSQGTTTFFIMCAIRPEYNDKINIMAALAPTAYMSKLSNPVIHFASAPAVNLALGFFAETIKLNVIMPHSDIITQFGKTVCVKEFPYNGICNDIYSLIGGRDDEQFDLSLIPVVLSNAPAGAALKQFMHYAQEIYSGFFRPYDYGIIKNRKIYKQDKPPSYNTSQITAPIALYYGLTDNLASYQDVQKLAKELPNVVQDNLMPQKTFTHLDFLWAKDIDTMLNNNLIKLFSSRNGLTGDSTINLPNSLVLTVFIFVSVIVNLF